MSGSLASTNAPAEAADAASGITLTVKSLSGVGGDSCSAPTKEEHHHGQEGSLQREMLKDPRFGSPLLCDAVVMLLALVPLLCGLQEYFTAKPPANSSLGGFHYGLILCGIFIFLLGLRSASLHLTNMADTTEERVLYILEKHGGSVWIPAMPKMARLPPGYQPPRDRAPYDATATCPPGGTADENIRLLFDPRTQRGYMFSSRRESTSTIDQLDLSARDSVPDLQQVEAGMNR